jgi:hypothetical protein
MSKHGNRLVEAPTNSDQELRLLVEAIPALVWRAGPEGDIEYVNMRVGARLGRLSVDGGATRNDLLMQFQADLLGRPVQRLKVLELSAFGAGLLAAASGLMEEAGIDAMLNSATEEINPRLDPFRTQLKIGVSNAAVDPVIDSAKSSRRHIFAMFRRRIDQRPLRADIFPTGIVRNARTPPPSRPRSQSDSDSPLAPEIPINVTARSHHTSDRVAELLLQGRPPWHKSKPHPIIDHGEPVRGERDTPAIDLRNMLAFSGRAMAQPGFR